MSFDIEHSAVEITCEGCGDPVDVRITGFETTVEIAEDAACEICHTDKRGMNLHYND